MSQPGTPDRAFLPVRAGHVQCQDAAPIFVAFLSCAVSGIAQVEQQTPCWLLLELIPRRTQSGRSTSGGRIRGLGQDGIIGADCPLLPQAKQTGLPQQNSPDRLFAAQLTGEEPPRVATVQTLYEEAMRLYAVAPWDRLYEDQLVLCDDPVSGERCYLSVMGILGEFRGFQVYLGNAGYRFFRRMQERHEELTAGDFLATQRSLSVHWGERADLTKQDRELLTVVGHPKKRGLAAPQFRSLRLGYHPWYVTEQEAQTLTICLRAFLFAEEKLSELPARGVLNRAGVFPLVVVNAEGIPQEVKPEKPAEPRPETGPTVIPEMNRLESIRAQRLRHRGVIKIDHFYGIAKVGARNERPACLRIAIAVDEASGIVHPPRVLPPQAVTGEALVELLFQAVEISKALPKQVLVSKEECRAMLAPVAKLLDVPVRVAPGLPALERARDSLFAMMGDPGLIDAEGSS